MTRALAVVAAVLLLLGVGWFVGHRPVGAWRYRLEDTEARFQERAAVLEQRTAAAEAREFVWQARCELLLAAQNARDQDYAGAAEHAGLARDLLTRAAGHTEVVLDLGSHRDAVEAVVRRLEGRDPSAGAELIRLSEALAHILEDTGRA